MTLPDIEELKAMGLFERIFRPNIEELKARRDVEGLIRALKNICWDVRRDAAKALGEIGDRRAVEPLIEALRDSDLGVRSAAAHALGKIGDERAVEPLIEALDDVDVIVQIKAAKALHKIGNERAVEALKHKRVFERLIRALKDSEWPVRANATEALGEIGDERAVEPLIEALEEIREAKELVIRIRESERRKGARYVVFVPEAEELIRNAESALKIGDYENAMKLAKQVEEKVLGEVFVLYLAFVLGRAHEIYEIRNSGVKVPESEELIEEAIAELHKKNFGRAEELAKEARRKAIERREEYNRALSLINL